MGDSGFIELLLDVNEMVARLQSRISQVLRRQERGIPAILESLRPFSDMDHKVEPQVKLPKLNLPNFDGNYLNCQEFWDIFKSTIPEQDLPNFTRLSYLKGFLCGAAATAISGIPVTNDNYDSTIKLLTDKFGKMEVIINALYSKLQSLQ